MNRQSTESLGGPLSTCFANLLQSVSSGILDSFKHACSHTAYLTPEVQTCDSVCAEGTPGKGWGEDIKEIHSDPHIKFSHTLP